MTFYIIIRGPLGCGKTTISKKLAKEIGAEYFSVDKVLEENELTSDWEEGYISQKSFLKSNQILLPKIKDYLNKGIPVIIDGNFYWKSQIEDLIKNLNFKAYIFTLKAPLEVCINRDKIRKERHGKKAAEEVYQKVLEFDFGETLNVDRSIEECLKKLFSRISHKKTV